MVMIVGSIALLILIFSTVTAYRHPHLRRMAVRNLLVRRYTTLFTIVGAMVGTALITTSLLISSSLQGSIDRFIEEQFGPIVSDLPASEQTKLQGTWQREDLHELEEWVKRENYHEQILPTVGFNASLFKTDATGKPLLFSPKTYVYGFDLEKAKRFDAHGMQEIPINLAADEILLSKRAADQLEVKTGDQIFVIDARNKERALRVKKVVTEQGLTGYRGTEQARATAIVSLDTARALTSIPEGHYTNVLLGAPPGMYTGMNKIFYKGTTAIFMYVADGWKIINVREAANDQLNDQLKFLPTFYIASLSAILVGIALVVNLFKMLAEERRQEWGVLRAIGMNRQDLSRLLRLEGLLYGIFSSMMGVVVGIGLAYLLMMQLKDLFSLMAEYDSQLIINYHFSLNPFSLVTGFSIGILIIYSCVALVARRAASIPIIEALAGDRGQDLHRRAGYRSLIQRIAALLFSTLAVSVFLISRTKGFQQWINRTEIEPLLVFFVGFLLILLTVLAMIAVMPFIFSGLSWLVRPFPRLFGSLRIAFRAPELNRTRTGLLFFMFSLVLFLTSFSSLFVASFTGFFGDFDSRRATGGYDLVATTGQRVSTSDVEEILESSEYVDSKEIEAVVAVPQLFSEIGMGGINGVEDRYAETITIPLAKKDSRFRSDREVWEELARNPDVVVVDEETAKFGMDLEYGQVFLQKPFTVGDPYPVILGDPTDGDPKVVQKQIIGIAKYDNENYGFPASSGLWLKASEIDTLAMDGQDVQTTLLLRAKSESSLNQLAKDVEKTFNQNNIFGLRNPQEEFLVGSLFIQTFFSLFEVFSALATVIGIAGMMVVMFRVLRERRQQIGMLRSIGIPAKSIFFSVLVEGAFIAWIGIVIGMGVGSYTGFMMIDVLAAEEEVTVLFPYGKLALYFIGAFLLTLLCAILPAYRAMRLSPVEATRYVG